MANLSTLLTARVGSAFRGIEELRGGNIFFFTPATSYSSGVPNPLSGTYGNTTSCGFCWRSPGTGTAVIELWGAAGGAAGMCCCSAGGVPGNAPAYSKRTVAVTASSYVCGFAGFGNTSATSCYSYSRASCSVACLFNITASNCLMVAQGGHEGVHVCTSSTASFCCLAAIGYCNTLLNTYCGIVCNVGGPTSASAACACGGDTNISGPISCVEYLDCCNYWPEAMMYTYAIPAGIYSTVPMCIRFNGSGCSIGYNTSPGFVNNRNTLATQLAGLTGTIQPSNYAHMNCWAGGVECNCYLATGCAPIAPALPGTSGFTCGGQQVIGVRGGAGMVKITFYS